ncbi:MAG: 50S ribosomal protein L1 [Chloroflexi bacterium]|jgi:large subunit ribosomal protein L1|nr:50S ribosomal protein L1 [Chloroflexota bacterium]MBT7080544.1 50S ribosomal protein L1 [Chloroflexota bacterium]MBT7289648.1 50S ribosomal protein L1 [Chloroflexota bacterium]
MAKQGKKYQEAAKIIDKEKLYTPEEAMELAKKAAYTKFDETVELHLRMNLDPRHADQQLRGVALLPNGLGKKVRIIVFTQGEAVKVAEDEGADFVGDDELIKKIEDGWLEFDVAIATPDMMAKVSKLGRILGRKGLMPNPKAGTVAPPQNLPRVISDARKGRVEFKLDKTAIIHVPIGKASFEGQKLTENFNALMDAVIKGKPSGAKGHYIKSATITTTMGPGIKLDVHPILAAA